VFIDMARYKSAEEFIGFDFLTGHLIRLDTRTWTYDYLYQSPGRSIHGLTYDLASDIIYFVEFASGRLRSLHLPSATETILLSDLAEPAHVAMEPGTGALLLTELLGGRLVRYRPRTGPVTEVNASLRFADLIQLDLAGQRAWVSSFAPNGDLASIDLATGAASWLGTRLQLAAGLALRQTRTGSEAVVTEADRGEVWRIDLRSGRETRVAMRKLVAPSYVGILSDGVTAWIMEAGATRVVTVQLETNTVSEVLDLRCVGGDSDHSVRQWLLGRKGCGHAVGSPDR
jgi:streptogramin lyase